MLFMRQPYESLQSDRAVRRASEEHLIQHSPAGHVDWVERLGETRRRPPRGILLPRTVTRPGRLLRAGFYSSVRMLW